MRQTPARTPPACPGIDAWKGRRVSQPNKPSPWAIACQAPPESGQAKAKKRGSWWCLPHLLDCACHSSRGARRPVPHAVRAVRHCPAQAPQQPAFVTVAATAAGAAAEGALLPLLPRPRGRQFVQPAVGPQELKKVGGVCRAGRAGRVQALRSDGVLQDGISTQQGDCQRRQLMVHARGNSQAWPVTAHMPAGRLPAVPAGTCPGPPAAPPQTPRCWSG